MFESSCLIKDHFNETFPAFATKKLSEFLMRAEFANISCFINTFQLHYGHAVPPLSYYRAIRSSLPLMHSIASKFSSRVKRVELLIYFILMEANIQSIIGQLSSPPALVHFGILQQKFDYLRQNISFVIQKDTQFDTYLEQMLRGLVWSTKSQSFYSSLLQLFNDMLISRDKYDKYISPQGYASKNNMNEKTQKKYKLREMEITKKKQSERDHEKSASLMRTINRNIDGQQVSDKVKRNEEKSQKMIDENEASGEEKEKKHNGVFGIAAERRTSIRHLLISHPLHYAHRSYKGFPRYEKKC